MPPLSPSFPASPGAGAGVWRLLLLQAGHSSSSWFDAAGGSVGVAGGWQIPQTGWPARCTACARSRGFRARSCARQRSNRAPRRPRRRSPNPRSCSGASTAGSRRTPGSPQDQREKGLELDVSQQCMPTVSAGEDIESAPDLSSPQQVVRRPPSRWPPAGKRGLLPERRGVPHRAPPHRPAPQRRRDGLRAKLSVMSTCRSRGYQGG